MTFPPSLRWAATSNFSNFPATYSNRHHALLSLLQHSAYRAPRRKSKAVRSSEEERRIYAETWRGWCLNPVTTLAIGYRRIGSIRGSELEMIYSWEWTWCRWRERSRESSPETGEVSRRMRSPLWEVDPMRNWRRIESKMGLVGICDSVWRGEAPWFLDAL